MKSTHPTDLNKRRVLQALASGLLGVPSLPLQAQALGRVPGPLPAGQSIYNTRGTVSVNGVNTTSVTTISANDTVVTGTSSQIIFVVGKDAFLMRENSRLKLSGNGFLVEGMQLLSGAVLSVFGKSRHQLKVGTATVGIRGTGVYAQAQADAAYICTCYGVVDIGADGSTESETIESKHHDAPRYIASSGSKRITPAPFIDHSDEELMLIETLVGRVPPFSLFDPGYGGRRQY